MSKAFEICSDVTLTYDQQLKALAKLGEATDDSLPVTLEFKEAYDKGILCDLNEGCMPFRPRYICPDYRVLMEKGCKFLNLEAPKDIWEACNSLLILYKHVPSITTFPVYLGNFDELFEPFVQDEEEARKALRLFLRHIDSTLTDSFVHANLGPRLTKAGRIILELTKEMQLAIPNITLLYNPDITAEEDALFSIDSMLHTAKPSFANDKLFLKDFNNEPYCIASCYNGLLIGGGGFTLPRVRLATMAHEAKDLTDFIENVLPKYAEILLDHMDRRCEYMVEKSNFFKSNFLIKEGFLHQEKFVGLFGVVGLAECVNYFHGIEDKSKGFGNDPILNKEGQMIIEALEKVVNSHVTKYCDAFGHHHILHAQVGIDSDTTDNSPGCRIPVGSEPGIHKHVMHSCLFHKFFPSGIGDIFKFDETWEKNEAAILDIIRGAFNNDMRYFSGYLADCDVIRVTGYLVKKSEVAKLDAGGQSLNQVTVFGKGARDYGKAFDRRVQSSND
ncbi:MAG: YjjI family glycine radical enzyme [Erysipelotrichales bacterium]|nr:YjjI family glycine radical enzyme [Erysipelotrichales bacterium]